jgi:predicted dinucleotide-binding enzyme
MQIGILGTGTLATALAQGWSEAGHALVVGGRDHDQARALAERHGGSAVPPRAVTGDAVLLAVSHAGVEPMLAAAGDLRGVPLIDPTNTVEHGVGELLTPAGESTAGRIAALTGAHVVKAFHLYPAAQWTERPEPVVVPICGDDAVALATVATLVRDVGGEPIAVGGLARARQLEEAAGFVIALAFAGADPRLAIPHVGRE